MSSPLPRLLLLAVASCAAPSTQVADLEQQDPARTIRSIEVHTRDVFTDEEAEQRLFYRAFNALHVTTEKAVLLREVWLREGETVTPDEVAELERHLRRTGLFGEVTVQLRPEADGEARFDGEAEETEEADLVITTRDRFSLTAGAAGFFVGGVSGFSAEIGETNLAGQGDRLFASFRSNSEDEESTGLSYMDRHLLDTRARLHASVGETEEGSSFSLGVDRPFWHLQDPVSYGAFVSHSESETDFFAGGDTVAEVPRDSDGAHVWVSKASGPRDSRRTYGVDLRLADTRYGAARGPAAGTIEVPGDVSRVTLGPYVRHEWITSDLELMGLDAIDIVEDVRLGTRAEFFTAGVARDEEGEGERLEPFVSASLRTALAPLADTYVTLGSSANWRTFEGEMLGRNLSTSLHVFQKSLDWHTFAASVTFDSAFEGEDLPAQLTLGEDNGLRGYPAREFAGTRRLRLNVEDRIDTGLDFWSLHVGLVPFLDVGWIGDEELGEARSSAGLGLRFGSSELLGRGVLRLDFAVPLDEVDGEEFDPTVSLALGQVFGLFGNSSALPGR